MQANKIKIMFFAKTKFNIFLFKILELKIIFLLKNFEILIELVKIILY